jgi:hypothetical protein
MSVRVGCRRAVVAEASLDAYHLMVVFASDHSTSGRLGPRKAMAFALVSLLLGTCSKSLGVLVGAPTRKGQVMKDPGFEALPAGLLASSAPGDGWEIQRRGRHTIQNRLIVASVKDTSAAKSGQQSVSLSIPRDTVGFEFVTVGQRHRLAAGVEFEASLWVRWAGGPDRAAEGTSPNSGHPSAIVSFWARHRDGMGDFAGRDEWIFDNRWTRIAFRLRATDPDQPTFLYASLLPNQRPASTTVLVDDFELWTLDDPAETEPRQGNLVRDSGFADALAPPWYFANLGGNSIRGTVARSGGERFVTIAMGEKTSNFESAQLWQHLELREGVRYVISARLRWDSYVADAPAPIVNYGIFHEASRTWYGPVDQVLKKSGGWNTYSFVHVPPAGGAWKLYVQLNGWGNFGNGVTVSIDDVTCTPGQ